jgi:hypothetical protein
MERRIIEGTEPARRARRASIAFASGLAVLLTAAFAGPAAAGKPARPVCGNGIAESGEACDTSDLRSKTCQVLGFTTGTLVCTAQCSLETSGCSNVRFVDNADGTVTDYQTGLQWEKKDAADGVIDYSNPHDVNNKYTWGNLAGCTYLGCPNGSVIFDFLGRLNLCVSDGTTVIEPGFAGHCDWRIPTIEELKTLFDPMAPSCGYTPCLDPVFGPSEGLYVSATTSPNVPVGEYVKIHYTLHGGTGNLGKVHGSYYRAVRTAF